MKKYKAIIFDFDGVICNSVNVKTLAFANMYEQYGAEVVKKVVEYHKEHGGISRYEKFKYYHKNYLGLELSDEQVQKMGKEFSDLAMQKVIDSNYIPFAHEFLTRNSKRYLQFICTGTPDIEIHEILKKKNIYELFNGVYGSPQTKVEIINRILEINNLQNNEVVFLGDAMTDYNAAKKCNIDFIGILNDDTTFPATTITINNFNDALLTKFL
jgi:phosphoglycolate phosphatase-like HAD superfamily hydrolase